MPAAPLLDARPHPATDAQIFANETQAWVQTEFASLDLGDKRREDRFRIMMTDFCARPQASTPTACEVSKKTKAVYRLMNNHEIAADAVLAAHRDALCSRLPGAKVVLAIQDTSTLNFTHHRGKKGLGPISTDPGLQGFFAHPTLAVTPDRTPLGLIQLQRWVRKTEEFGKAADRHKKDIEEKESMKWLTSFDATEAFAQQYQDLTFVNIGDRESDIYELFERTRNARAALLIRGVRERGVMDEEHPHLWDFVRAQPLQETLQVTVARRKGKKERTATVEIRFTEVTLKAPHRKSDKAPLTINAVYVCEPFPPPGEEALEWLLLTTLRVKSCEDAKTCVEYYAVRFTIEIFFKVLKSGCRIESRQYEQADDLMERCLPTYALVAWRLLYLTMVGRSHPDLPCTAIFEDHEWKSLSCYVKNTRTPPEKPPSLKEAILLVARLGGFLARKSDGQPGVKTMWEGLQKLAMIAGSWMAFGPGRTAKPSGP